MNKFISVIIPNYNGRATIGKCLEAAFASSYRDFEVIVVDDCSTDDSTETIGRFPCTLIRLDSHSGASAARNAGARNGKGEILFFIDADCLMMQDTLALVAEAYKGYPKAVIGGTYTRVSCDDTFFSAFQSIFVNYSETKRREPDYIATHALAIDRGTFEESGGFSETFLPILEDVEFSHRLKRSGYRLKMNPDILVRHIFNFTFAKSLRNAFRKSMFWTIYSLRNRNLLADSGTASAELKINGASLFIGVFLLLLSYLSKKAVILFLLPLLLISNLVASRGLIKSFYLSKGLFFSISATIYYVTLYPLAAGTGAAAGALRYLMGKYPSPNPLPQGARVKKFPSLEGRD